MKINDILDAICELACSQGFYGRLYEQLMEIKDNDTDTWNKIVSELEKQNFKTTLDMVLYFEC